MRWYIFVLLQLLWNCANGGAPQDSCINSSSISLDDSFFRQNLSRTTHESSIYTSHDSFLLQEAELKRVSAAKILPRLFFLDNFEQCMSRPRGVYCVIDAHIAQRDEPIYNYIREYSSDIKKHYNRTNLHKGLCVSNRCGIIKDNITKQDLITCVNNIVYDESAVQIGDVDVKYCHSSDEEETPADGLDQGVAVLVAVLLFLATAGTTHHILMRAGILRENNMAMAFSLINNWQILRTGGGSGSENFDSLQGIRFLTMLIIIGAHGFLVFAHGYIENPEFIESLYDHPLSLWIFNGRVIVQSFFVMSGFLLAFYVLMEAERRQLSVAMLPSLFINRAMRLLPSTLVVMALMATWIPRSGSGPLWQLMVGEERDICRKSWWKQLLFVQNGFAFEDVCLPQTWYTAADTQLYLASFVVLVAVTRYRSRAWLILSATLAASVLVPAIQTYFSGLMPVRTSLYPETFVNMFAGNWTFISAYMSAQANWAGYTLGMMTAFLHHENARNKWNLEQSVILKRLYQISIPVALWTVWTGWEYHSRPATRLEAAVFNSLDHTLFAVTMCIFILGCLYKFDNVMRGIVEWAPLQPLGRLSFGALLFHTVVLRTYIGHMPYLLHASIYNVVFIVCSTKVLTFVCATLLFLLVEQPAVQLQKIMLGIKSKKCHSNETCQKKLD